MYMISFVGLLMWSLIVFGIANGIANSRLLESFRFWALYKNTGKMDGNLPVYTKRKISLFGELVQCVWCMSFWTGGILGQLYVTPTWCFITDCFLGSAVGWLIYVFVAERQDKL